MNEQLMGLLAESLLAAAGVVLLVLQTRAGLNGADRSLWQVAFLAKCF